MRNEIIIDKMIRYADKIMQYSGGMDYDVFAENEIVAEACVLNLIQLGELTNKLDDGFKEMHPEIPWHQIYGLRNRIVHDYEGVKFRLVWKILSEDIPALREKLNKICAKGR